jgi:hypothetical protein
MRGRDLVGLLVVCSFVVGACKSHEDASERDHKGRSSARVGDPPPTTTATTATGTGRFSRDSSAVEVGAYTYRWTGTIRESTGKAPAVGKTCTLMSNVWSTSATTINHDMLKVICDGQTLYDDQARMSGQAQWEMRLGENTAFETSTYTYELTIHDIGVRTGDRNQLTASTKDNELIVFRDISPTFRVTVLLDATKPTRHGKPIFETEIPPFANIVTRQATLATSSGPLPFTGKTCVLVIAPGSSRHNCRVRLTCAANIVFGTNTSGYEDCKLDATGVPTGFVDLDPTSVDHDPEMTVDLGHNSMLLSDVLPNGSTYSATFTLL